MVEHLLRGDDNVVRAAVVRVVGGKGDQLQRLRRPIQHLIPIEVRAEEQDSNVRNDDRNKSNEAAVPETSRKRPWREAAVVGELKRMYADMHC